METLVEVTYIDGRESKLFPYTALDEAWKEWLKPNSLSIKCINP